MAMTVDVALVPAQARRWGPTVAIVIDELRASSTITTVLDLGSRTLMLTSGLAEARRLARAHGAVLAGERHGVLPRGFDVNNSPAELLRIPVRDRDVVLCTTNGTRILARLAGMPLVLVGCLLNAEACARVAVEAATALGVGVGIVCAGQQGRFAVDDGVAAGVLARRVLDELAARSVEAEITDATRGALRLGATDDLVRALRESASGRLLASLGADEDVELCARVDASATVPVLRPGVPLRVERLHAIPVRERALALA